MESQQAEGTVRTRLDDTTALDCSGRVVGNREVGPQELSFGVDRIQWNFEPMRNHAENCFEL